VDKKEMLRKFILDELVPSKLKDTIDLNDDYPLVKSGIMDSFGALKVLSFIDEKFEIFLDPDELQTEDFSTLNTLYAYLNKKLDAN
jgi:acyl carrier protein